MSVTPLRIKELTPEEARRALAANPTLIVPVGTCEQHGPHLPLGCDTIVVERLADDLSAEFGVLRAPVIEYGVNDPAEALLAGSASVRRKTLRRFLNDLIPDWERDGVTDILVLTMNGHAPHQEALGTVVARRARVRVIDILALDFSGLVEFPDDPIHGGEVDTSLLLYVAPHLVKTELAVDVNVPESVQRSYRRGSVLAMPAHSPGSIGHPSRASAAKGERIYTYILDRIRARVFGANPGVTVG